MKTYQYIVLLLMEGLVLSLFLIAGFVFGGSLVTSTPPPENASIVVEKVPITVIVPVTQLVYQASTQIVTTPTPTSTPTITPTEFPAFSEYMATMYPIQIITPTPIETPQGLFAQEAGKIKQLFGDGGACYGNS